ncbi:helix-turn-helix domain-containing protein [Photobacterium andalusiense]|uniref:Bacteriophage CI repressor helix-turn-helix domain protein n=1 Tax=Photobacterium andalusiense TaxID=2204296 RepID=A0A1Y6MF94_9GAMM|nr:helix-turn-helix domain-containing protein [Photobacterium andalusiense]SMY35204.1 Bacteriophage CI repressor helix-turn-helix domain protein [Photobacterium andalusiense]
MKPNSTHKSHVTTLSSYQYLGGKAVTSKLCSVLDIDEYQDLADVFNIPRGTVSTWHSRETTPFEIAIRSHLATGVSLHWLLLNEGEAFPHLNTSMTKADSDTLIVPHYQLKSGQLTPLPALSFDQTLLKQSNNEPPLLMALQTTTATLIIDKSDILPISGNYLISIDQLLSINDIQRLPAKQLALHYGQSSITLAQDDIEVIGKVIISIDHI